MEVSIKYKLKELLNHGLFFGVTSSLQNVLGFVLLPILTSYYTPAEFGVYSIILLASAFASAIFYLGANSALGRFYYHEDSDNYRKSIISTSLYVTFIGALFLVALSFILGKSLSLWLFNSDKYYLHIKLALSGAAFGFLLNTMTLILRYQKRSVMFMFITLAGVIINFLITYILLTKYHYGILSPLYGLLISNLLNYTVLLLLYFKSLTFKITRQHINQILSFGLQSSATGILYYLLDWVDRLIIKDLLPMADVGIYSLGYRLGAILNILLVVPFSLIWAPIRMQYAQNSNNKTFIAKVISYYSITGILLVFLAVLFGENLMNFFFHNRQFSSAGKLYPIIMLSMLFFGYQNIVDYGIYLHKKIYFYVIISTVGLIFNVVMNYIFIPHFGYIAAAYVTLFTYLLTTMLIYFASYNYYALEIEWGRVAIPLSFLVICYFALNNDYLSSYNYLKKAVITVAGIYLFIKYWLSDVELNALKNRIYRREKA